MPVLSSFSITEERSVMSIKDTPLYLESLLLSKTSFFGFRKTSPVEPGSVHLAQSFIAALSSIIPAHEKLNIYPSEVYPGGLSIKFLPKRRMFFNEGASGESTEHYVGFGVFVMNQDREYKLRVSSYAEPSVVGVRAKRETKDFLVPCLAVESLLLDKVV